MDWYNFLPCIIFYFMYERGDGDGLGKNLHEISHKQNHGSPAMWSVMTKLFLLTQLHARLFLLLSSSVAEHLLPHHIFLHLCPPPQFIFQFSGRGMGSQPKLGTSGYYICKNKRSLLKESYYQNLDFKSVPISCSILIQKILSWIPKVQGNFRLSLWWRQNFVELAGIYILLRIRQICCSWRKNCSWRKKCI